MVKDQGNRAPSFEDRLRDARRKQGLEPAEKASFDKDAVPTAGWALGLRVGIELVTALVVAVAIGYALDRLFGTKPILTVVFVPLGMAAGVANLWRMFAPKPDRKTE